MERQPAAQSTTNGRPATEQVHFIATESTLSEPPASSNQLDDYFEFSVVYAFDRAVVVVQRDLNLEPVVQVK
jgi:hypothetical protein